jgi:hypothetical protein
MAYRVGQYNFSKGVFSDELQSRLDVDAYHAGMKQCVNAYILKQGGIVGRPGTRIVYETSSPLVRLIPFEVSQDQTYMMLLEQASMKPMFLGGMVLETELVITGITNATQAAVTAAYHGFSVGDEVYFAGQLGMIEINGRTATVMSVPDASHFTVSIDSTAFTAWTGSTGGIVNAAPPPPPPAPPPVPPVISPPAPPPVAPTLGGGVGAGAGFGYGFQPGPGGYL